MMRSGLLTPGAVSTPDETSTMVAPVAAMPSATFSAVNPPDSMNGTRSLTAAMRRQSNASPLPPGSAPARSFGAFASNKIKRATST